MGLAHFFYGDWDADDAATSAQDELIKACVALEEHHGGTDEALAITTGYRSVYVNARVVADGEDDFDPRYFDTAAEVEQFYRKLYLKAYLKVVRRSYPKYETDGDGLGWWPESLKLDGLWPRKLLARIAVTMGEIEAERAVACSRYFEQQEQQRSEGA